MTLTGFGSDTGTDGTDDISSKIVACGNDNERPWVPPPFADYDRQWFIFCSLFSGFLNLGTSLRMPEQLGRVRKNWALVFCSGDGHTDVHGILNILSFLRDSWMALIDPVTLRSASSFFTSVVGTFSKYTVKNVNN